jgi:hypothetical protein
MDIVARTECVTPLLMVIPMKPLEAHRSENGTDTGDVILSGGTEIVIFTGISDNPIVSGGGVLVNFGGTVSGAQVSASGVLVNLSGTVSSTIVSSGGVLLNGNAANNTIGARAGFSWTEAPRAIPP